MGFRNELSNQTSSGSAVHVVFVCCAQYTPRGHLRHPLPEPFNYIRINQPCFKRAIAFVVSVDYYERPQSIRVVCAG